MKDVPRSMLHSKLLSILVLLLTSEGGSGLVVEIIYESCSMEYVAQ